MVILAIDPGSEESAYIYLNPVSMEIEAFGKTKNENLVKEIYVAQADQLVIEQIKSYGMPVGDTVFETVFWSGRFAEAWGLKGPLFMIPRATVKSHICGSAKATDSNVRKSVIDIFGGQDIAQGTKKRPGRLYGVKSDVWQALALALCHANIHPGVATYVGDMLEMLELQ